METVFGILLIVALVMSLIRATLAAGEEKYDKAIYHMLWAIGLLLISP
jgi:hypothetical protein